MSERAHAFDPVTLRILSEAFDKEWDAFLRRGELTPKDSHTSRRRLAQLILDEARNGELDSHTLARSTIDKLRHENRSDKRG